MRRHRTDARVRRNQATAARREQLFACGGGWAGRLGASAARRGSTAGARGASPRVRVVHQVDPGGPLGLRQGLVPQARRDQAVDGQRHVKLVVAWQGGGEASAAAAAGMEGIDWEARAWGMGAQRIAPAARLDQIPRQAEGRPDIAACSPHARAAGSQAAEAPPSPQQPAALAPCRLPKRRPPPPTGGVREGEALVPPQRAAPRRRGALLLRGLDRRQHRLPLGVRGAREEDGGGRDAVGADAKGPQQGGDLVGFRCDACVVWGEGTGAQ